MERKITVPNGYVKHLLGHAESQGYQVSSLLEHVGISPDEIEDQTEFPAQKFWQLYQRIIWITQDESFGMISGGKVPNGTFRMMCHAILHCKTLERVMWRCSDFYEICRGSRIKPVLLRRGRYAKISFAPTQELDNTEFQTLLENEPPHSIRTSLSVWQHFTSWLIGTRLEIKAAYFSFPEPEDADYYRTLFRSEIRFNQHANALVFPARFLDYPIVQTEDTLKGFLKTAPFQLHVMVDDDKSLKSQVMAIIGKDFSRDLPSADEVAHVLHMSVSTLRRRLLEEGTSYQKIKDDCRKEGAINYMNSPQLSINDVASLMGFDEPSAFFRSFKKWTQMTPGEYRKSAVYCHQFDKS
ncbi:AraC family transcriptional regulator [Neptunomonas japonica]|uniref:AraC family transcriptional regulator n=1 Tax=Neptunomonas japonica JAMM 1380 TaxID=1441457 RepID=A0A7R6PV43_9GAMM|nr:AraC family transcriptional regulator [Neptunomonas japonica]BBB31085.1 AraC family transcriptional regulator [Neptunomonas japonica JAMM 1380]